MSDRDELAKLLFTVDNVGAPDPEHEWEILTRHSPTHTEYVYVMADALVADGYRKPRTITTTDELDALPVGSVVLHNGRAFQHYPAYPAPFDEYQKWKCGDGGFVRSTKDGSSILPATVLHEPEPQS